MKLHKNTHIYNIEVMKQKNCLKRILIKKIKRNLKKIKKTALGENYKMEIN